VEVGRIVKRQARPDRLAVHELVYVIPDHLSLYCAQMSRCRRDKFASQNGGHESRRGGNGRFDPPSLKRTRQQCGPCRSPPSCRLVDQTQDARKVAELPDQPSQSFKCQI
jgi:hypothetical protein